MFKVNHFSLRKTSNDKKIKSKHSTSWFTLLPSERVTSILVRIKRRTNISTPNFPSKSRRIFPLEARFYDNRLRLVHIEFSTCSPLNFGLHAISRISRLFHSIKFWKRKSSAVSLVNSPGEFTRGHRLSFPVSSQQRGGGLSSCLRLQLIVLFHGVSRPLDRNVNYLGRNDKR